MSKAGGTGWHQEADGIFGPGKITVNSIRLKI